MAIPATDLTINSVIVFARVWKDKDHHRNGSDTLVFWWWFPSGLCKNKVLLIVFLPQLHYHRLNRTTIWKDFSQHISKYMALKVWSLNCFKQCISWYTSVTGLTQCRMLTIMTATCMYLVCNTIMSKHTRVSEKLKGIRPSTSNFQQFKFVFAFYHRNCLNNDKSRFSNLGNAQRYSHSMNLMFDCNKIYPGRCMLHAYRMINCSGKRSNMPNFGVE